MFEVLVIYRWASVGGVERMLLNRAHAFREHARDIRLNVFFLEDIGGISALKHHARVRGLEDHFRIIENVTAVAPDLAISIDTPQALSMVPPDCPLVLECHTFYVENRDYLTDLHEAARPFHAIWVPSTTFRDMLQRENRDLPVPIQVVSNCLPPRAEQLENARSPYPGVPVLYLGRSDTLKNTVSLARLVSRARSISGVDLRLLVIGDVYDATLRPTIEACGLSEYAHVLPAVGFHETSSIYQTVKKQGGVFMSASFGESFGLSAAEAMAEGLPVLLSDIPEHRLLVGGNERLLFAPDDPEAGAEKLLWVIRNGWRAASNWGRVCAKAFSSDAFITDWDRATESIFVSRAGSMSGFLPGPRVPQSGLAELWSMIEEQLEESRTASAERHAAIAERDAALSERDQAESDRDLARAQVEALTIELGKIQHLNADVLASYSWRITAPIRFAIRFARHGLLAEDRRWFEDVLRGIFHRLPLGVERKEALFHWYGRKFGYPIGTPGRQPAPPGLGHPVEQFRTLEGALPASGKEEFLAPEGWSHRHTPYGIVCLPIIEWRFRFQRPQQLARSFARKGHSVVYASHAFGKRSSLETLETGITGITLPGNAKLNVYKDMPTSREVHVMAEALIQHMEAGPSISWVCIVQLPFWAPVAEELRRRAGCGIVYDCMDDHSGFSTNGDTMLAAEERLLREADLVVSSSKLLNDKTGSKATRTALIRNGVDYEHFAAVPDTRHESPTDLVIGYYGAIADWFDSALVAAVAEARPAWRFVLIGSTFSADTAPLTKCSNVILSGEKPYAELPSLIADWDCCIIPFKRIPLTEATNPVKVYEMLAAGKPVVAVSLPELLPMAEAGYVRASDTAEGFIQAIEQEVAQDDGAKQAERRRYASENTWEIRQEALDQAIRKTYPLVSIVIVTYNNLALNRLCLESVLVDTDYPNYEVIVVDNASSDGTQAYLRELLDPRVRVVLNADNRGFSAANNQGLALARGEFLCLLNNDTVVTGAWLSTLVSHLRTNREIGLVGPVTNAIGNEARISVDYRNLLDLPAWSNDYCRKHRGRLDDISMLAFFCVVMPRPVYEAVGPLDERFGIGMFEDDDYNRRVRAAGFSVKLARDCYIHHWQRASFKVLGEDAYFETYYENEKKYRAKWALQSMSRADGEKVTGLVEASRRAPATIVFAPSIGWNIHLFQRPHHLAKVFAELGYVVVFDCSNSHDDIALLKEAEPRLFLFKGEPELLLSLERLTLWTFSYNYDYRDRFPAGTPVIYDWIDDLTVFPQDQALLQRLHARAMKESALVACVARKLHETAARERPDAIYLPNAVEEGRFDDPPTPNPALNDKKFRRLTSSGRPIAGYYGALARWFDYELLARTAEILTDWNFVLIGPDHDGSIEQSGLSRHDNVVWLGPRDYQALPGYLHLFDVAMIPFRINDITVATSPLKLFEYFAGGRAVVATAMPECMAFPEVFVADTAEEFATRLVEAKRIAKDPAFLARLAALAGENTWRARAQAVLDSLNTEPDEMISAEAKRVMAMFRDLAHPGNRSYFRALASHLAGLADDPCLPMYFQFALSANDRGRAVAELLSRHVQIAGKRHLDVGCAYGGFLIAFSERGAQSSGFDIDPTLLELGKANFVDSGRQPATYHKDVTRLQDIIGFESSFDIVTCNDVIEHVGDPANALKNISLVLASGGMAYLEIPNRDAVSFVLQDGHYQLFGITQLDRDDAGEYYAAHAPGVTYGVEHYLRLPQYRALIADAGMDMLILDESLAGIRLNTTLDILRQLEMSVEKYLQTVPECVRERVRQRVSAYLERARAAPKSTEQEIKDFLMTFGAPFWKILARKKDDQAEMDLARDTCVAHSVTGRSSLTAVPEVFQGWQYEGGFCNVCGRLTRFFFQDPVLYRESLTCEHCRTTSRYRSIARGLLQAIRETTGIEAEALSQLPRTGVARRIRVYDTQPPFDYEPCAYPLPKYLEACDWVDLSLSSYKPKLPLGSQVRPGVENQNLERLTYGDGQFDIVITSDVMEHVRLDDQAHREIARVLKPGGIYVFTVPHCREWECNLIRVRIDNPEMPETDVQLLEPEYHGDANAENGAGALAYRAYGRELDRQLANLGLSVAYSKEDVPSLGIKNTELFYCRKVGAGARRPRVVVHAGAHKTGTTLIQTYLFNHTRDPFFYLDPEVINASGFLERVQGARRDSADLLEIAEGAGWKRDQTLLISHEALLGYGMMMEVGEESYFYGALRDNALRLKAILCDCDVDIVYYFRRQDEFIVSLYLEHLSCGHINCDFDAFLAIQDPGRMSWLTIADALVEVFGKEKVHFGLFEEISHGARAFIWNFLRRIGASVSEDEVPEMGRERPSFSAAAYELAKTAFEIPLSAEDRQKLNEFLRANFSNRTHPKAQLLSSERRRWLLDQCEADNRTLFAKYLPEYSFALWHGGRDHMDCRAESARTDAAIKRLRKSA